MPCIGACDEENARCEGECAVPDADGDGRDAVGCGGNDCDDTDADRFPGNPEICDIDMHDEDCDPNTFGVRDADMDGFPDDACCNQDGDELICGVDCDDTISGIHPTEAESCDTLDNDCDGSVDEGVVQTFWTDADLDGRGSDDPAAESYMGCSPPAGFAPIRGDCNDSDPAIATGLPELCDGAGKDEDCDGMVDEGARITCYPDQDDDSYSPAGAVAIDACADPNRSAVGGCPLGFSDRAPGTSPDCDDSDGDVSPGNTEVCNYRDDDCDGLISGDEASFVRAQLVDFDPVLVDSTIVSNGYAATSTRYEGVTSYPARGAVELMDTLTLGYGAVSLEVTVFAASTSSTPRGTWTVYAYREGVGASSSAGPEGYPDQREGVAGVWEWRPTTADSVRFMRSSATGADTELDSTLASGADSLEDMGTASQRMILTIEPDDPDTTPDETVIWLRVGAGIIGCSNPPLAGRPACGLTLRPGDRLRFGTGFGSNPSGSAVEISFRASDASVGLMDACP